MPSRSPYQIGTVLLLSYTYETTYKTIHSTNDPINKTSKGLSVSCRTIDRERSAVITVGFLIKFLRKAELIDTDPLIGRKLTGSPNTTCAIMWIHRPRLPETSRFLRRYPRRSFALSNPLRLLFFSKLERYENEAWSYLLEIPSLTPLPYMAIIDGGLLHNLIFMCDLEEVLPNAKIDNLTDEHIETFIW